MKKNGNLSVVSESGIIKVANLDGKAKEVFKTIVSYPYYKKANTNYCGLKVSDDTMVRIMSPICCAWLRCGMQEGGFNGLYAMEGFELNFLDKLGDFTDKFDYSNLEWTRIRKSFVKELKNYSPDKDTDDVNLGRILLPITSDYFILLPRIFSDVKKYKTQYTTYSMLKEIMSDDSEMEFSIDGGHIYFRDITNDIVVLFSYNKDAFSGDCRYYCNEEIKDFYESNKSYDTAEDYKVLATTLKNVMSVDEVRNLIVSKYTKEMFFSYSEGYSDEELKDIAMDLLEQVLA